MADKNHISKKNKSSALDNISKKIFLLQQWLNNGLPQGLNLANVPASLRQFNAWAISADKEYGVIFGANAAATLRQESALTKQVLGLIDAVRKNFSVKQKRRPLSDVAYLQQELKLEKSLRIVVEQNFVSARRDLHQAEKKQRALRSQLNNLENEAKEELARKSEEIAELTRANQELVAKMANLTPLKRTK